MLVVVVYASAPVLFGLHKYYVTNDKKHLQMPAQIEFFYIDYTFNMAFYLILASFYVPFTILFVLYSSVLDSLFVCITFMSASLFKIIQIRLEELDDSMDQMSDDEIMKEIGDIVRQHNKCIE
jgi:7tm Odorant receptor